MDHRPDPPALVRPICAFTWASLCLDHLLLLLSGLQLRAEQERHAVCSMALDRCRLPVSGSAADRLMVAYAPAVTTHTTSTTRRCSASRTKWSPC